MDSGITEQMTNGLPADMRPLNWLTSFGYPEGIMPSGSMKPSLSEGTARRLRSELAKWESNAMAMIAANKKPNSTDATMSFVDLKRAARSLPWNSQLRSLILAEPDSLPFQQGIAKIQVFSRLLYTEAQQSSG